MKQSVLLLYLYCITRSLASAAVVLKPFSLAFPDLPAKFGRRIDDSGVCGSLHLADPLDACSSLRWGVQSNATDQIRFALIVRGGCAFQEKLRNAQDAGFHAAIVYDDREKANLVYMMLNHEITKIYAVFVSKASGEALKNHARGVEGECCIYPSHSEAAWTVLAISFLSVIVIFALLVVVFMAPRHWLYGQHTNCQFKCIDTKLVEAFPCRTFNSDHLSNYHGGETCPICLEDYKDGEILKVLPCQHEFHSSCVDSWLTKWGTFCPVCKLDVRTKTAYSEVKRGIWA
ncbi:receptor homology region, transmembrane domain- and RING domain-containing protein 1 [Tripterygium wilfordii]|uniref:receptor homology region, transmembrane domain- and RING domain-containing protein 1 n=1 Tax=Tripterygium wilfordii TaxID=458696 RepID=UPI0018F8254D|nr:receptor homology region, transmembrane domain- and RING domain-containing protein 1 [Tripterygium wilfordii]